MSAVLTASRQWRLRQNNPRQISAINSKSSVNSGLHRITLATVKTVPAPSQYCCVTRGFPVGDSLLYELGNAHSKNPLHVTALHTPRHVTAANANMRRWCNNGHHQLPPRSPKESLTIRPWACPSLHGRTWTRSLVSAATSVSVSNSLWDDADLTVFYRLTTTQQGQVAVS